MDYKVYKKMMILAWYCRLNSVRWIFEITDKELTILYKFNIASDGFLTEYRPYEIMA